MRRLFALLQTVSLAAAACGDGDEGLQPLAGETTTSTAADEEEGVEEGADHGNIDGRFKAATVLPLTGDLKAFGPGMQAAAELAVEQINAAGGVLSPMELVTFDSGTDATKAGSAAEDAIGQGADFVIGEAGSTPTLDGVIPAIGRNTSVAGCSGSARSPALSDPQYDDWMRMVPSDIGQAEVQAGKIASAGHSSVAVVFRADEYGEALGEAVAAEAEAAGLDVVAEVSVDPGDESFDDEVEEVVAAEPDAVSLVLLPPEGAEVIRGLLEGGLTADRFYGGDGLADETLAAAVDPDDAGVLDGMSGTRPGTVEATADSAFVAELKATKRVKAVQFAETTANCLFVYALAAREAKSDDAREIRLLLTEVVSGGEECATYAECLPLVDADEDYEYTGAGVVLNESLEPDEGRFDVWKLGGGGKIQVQETVTVPIEAPNLAS
jgi:branched-chain amino acid transport system substrate-binding protein